MDKIIPNPNKPTNKRIYEILYKLDRDSWQLSPTDDGDATIFRTIDGLRCQAFWIPVSELPHLKGGE